MNQIRNRILFVLFALLLTKAYSDLKSQNLDRSPDSTGSAAEVFLFSGCNVTGTMVSFC